MVEELLKQIECMGILPVIKLNDAKDAVRLQKHCVKEDFHVQKLHSVQTQQKNLLRK